MIVPALNGIMTALCRPFPDSVLKSAPTLDHSPYGRLFKAFFTFNTCERQQTMKDQRGMDYEGASQRGASRLSSNELTHSGYSS